MFFIQTVLEFLIAGFIIWALFNESKLVDFEDRIISKIKNRFSNRKTNVYQRQSPSSENKYCA